MIGLAIAGEKALQPDDVPGRCGADQHGSARASMDQTHAAQNESAHDALAQICFRHQQGSNSLGRDQQGFYITLCGSIDQRPAIGELTYLGQKLTRTLFDDWRHMTQAVALRDRYAARQHHEHAGPRFAGFKQSFAGGVFA
jgi:hypothetical protein